MSTAICTREHSAANFLKKGVVRLAHLGLVVSAPGCRAIPRLHPANACGWNQGVSPTLRILLGLLKGM